METNTITQSIIPHFFTNDDYESVMDAVADRIICSHLTHYASSLLGQDLFEEDELELALQKAMETCTAAGMPLSNHFRMIYISVGGNLRRDWLVSDLGFHLVILNKEVTSPLAARLKIEVLTRTVH
ncbi:MAG: hypothetical protein ACTHMC_27505 [Pseudobacter sp.]|uniref:hypothetical protein n=1 Tax=Pseudobacter sp. TaxID=2045420 RepID=UPI003F7CE59C